MTAIYVLSTLLILGGWYLSAQVHKRKYDHLYSANFFKDWAMVCYLIALGGLWMHATINQFS